MAESMEDVRGGGRVVSGLGWGAVVAIGRVEEPRVGGDVRTGSETLRERSFATFRGWAKLEVVVSIGMASGSFTTLTIRDSSLEVIDRRGMEIRVGRNFSRKPADRPDAPLAIEVVLADCDG